MLSYELSKKLKEAGFPQDKVAHLKPHPDGKFVQQKFISGEKLR